MKNQIFNEDLLIRGNLSYAHFMHVIHREKWFHEQYIYIYNFSTNIRQRKKKGGENNEEMRRELIWFSARRLPPRLRRKFSSPKVGKNWCFSAMACLAQKRTINGDIEGEREFFKATQGGVARRLHRSPLRRHYRVGDKSFCRPHPSPVSAVCGLPDEREGQLEVRFPQFLPLRLTFASACCQGNR